MQEIEERDLSNPHPVGHRPGQRKNLMEALETADHWGWPPDELLNTDATGLVVSELLVARWKLAAALRPSVTAGETLDRFMYRWVDIPIRYSANHVVHDVTGTMSEAGLISSMRQDGNHLPALDLDYPAELWEDENRTRWLRIEPASPAIDYHGPDIVDEADRAMAAIGLNRENAPNVPMRSCRNEGRLIFRLGEQWAGTWKELISVAETMSSPTRPSRPPEGGVWYRLAGKGHLVPSTSWSHLYLDTIVPPKDYRSACMVAAGCGLLNPGFVNALDSRGFTSLRRPGTVKISREPMPIEDIPF